jgi:hypothetical protein
MGSCVGRAVARVAATTQPLTLVNKTAFTVSLWRASAGPYLRVPPHTTATVDVDRGPRSRRVRWTVSGVLPGLDGFAQELGGWDETGAFNTTVISIGLGGHVIVLDDRALALEAKALRAILAWQRGFRARSRASLAARAAAWHAAMRLAAVQIQRIARGAYARSRKPCAICYDDVPRPLLARPARGCGRAADHLFCVRCVRTYIDVSLASGRLHVRCPGGDCGALVERAALTTYGSRAAVAAYFDNLAAGHAERLAHEEDRAFVAFCAAETRRCPGCAVLIWRAGGCDHMTCMCGCEFQYDAAEAKVAF